MDIIGTVTIEDLCNGSTPDSDSVCGGSNPSSSAKNIRYPDGCLMLTAEDEGFDRIKEATSF